MKLWIIALVFWFSESWYFGWNEHPMSKAERICDLIALWLCVISLYYFACDRIASEVIKRMKKQ